MTNYLVSICVPIYGVEKYIERCATTLMEQTYNNIEYIFVNDSTKDRSIEILETVVDRYPNRKDSVRIIHHACNRGLAAARNTAIESASGLFLMHVDSDDWLAENAVELLVNAQDDSKSDMVFADAMSHYSDYKERITYPYVSTNIQMLLKMLRRDCNMYVWGKLIRKSLYIKHQISAKEGCNMGEDVQVTPLLVFASSKIVVIKDVIYNYDCSNVQSYTNVFNVKRDEENLKSVELLKQGLLKINREDLLDAFYIGHLKSIARRQMNAAAINNKDYYIKLKSIQSSIDLNYIKHVPFRDKIPLCIDSIYLIKLYALFFGYMKRCLKRL